MHRLEWCSPSEWKMADVCGISAYASKSSPSVVSDSPVTDPGSNIKVCVYLNSLKSNCGSWVTYFCRAAECGWLCRVLVRMKPVYAGRNLLFRATRQLSLRIQAGKIWFTESSFLHVYIERRGRVVNASASELGDAGFKSRRGDLDTVSRVLSWFFSVSANSSRW
jgi:hypothetical protein